MQTPGAGAFGVEPARATPVSCRESERMPVAVTNLAAEGSVRCKTVVVWGGVSQGGGL